MLKNEITNANNRIIEINDSIQDLNLEIQDLINSNATLDEPNTDYKLISYALTRSV